MEIESPIAFPMSMANVPKSNASVGSYDFETGDFCLGDLGLLVDFCPDFVLRVRLFEVDGFGDSKCSSGSLLGSIVRSPGVRATASA